MTNETTLIRRFRHVKHPKIITIYNLGVDVPVLVRVRFVDE